MRFRPPNYNQQRGDRERAKDRKRQERLERREEDSLRRKAEREKLLERSPDATPPVTPSEID
jgi:hypothetical protein